MACEDRGAGLRAKRSLDRLSQQPDHGVGINRQIWRLDFINLPWIVPEVAL